MDGNRGATPPDPVVSGNCRAGSHSASLGCGQPTSRSTVVHAQPNSATAAAVDAAAVTQHVAGLARHLASALGHDTARVPWGLWNGLTAWIILVVRAFGGRGEFPLFDGARNGNWD